MFAVAQLKHRSTLGLVVQREFADCIGSRCQRERQPKSRVLSDRTVFKPPEIRHSESRRVLHFFASSASDSWRYLEWTVHSENESESRLPPFIFLDYKPPREVSGSFPPKILPIN